ncbi:hypothetical protein [Vibrio coralliilyticus]|uniref:Uncharacterized protein n=1 Tax=Vibrio coralliilyticus TaxID=190893 RepID=A0AAP6ZPX2_9VIBR|nr:hypothetical protein [Vibrio coralliilyticus]NOI32042.1 hypothetical protein [Vibrio coralliilyticus]NOJ25242.1 hypothetical protein [Vibrio coralliilyticus]
MRDNVINGFLNILTLILIGAAIGGLCAISGDGLERIGADAYSWSAYAGVLTGFVVFKIRKAKGYAAGDKVELKLINAAFPVAVCPFFIGFLVDDPELLEAMSSDLFVIFIYLLVFLSVSSLGLISTERKAVNRVNRI